MKFALGTQRARQHRPTSWLALVCALAWGASQAAPGNVPASGPVSPAKAAVPATSSATTPAETGATPRDAARAARPLPMGCVIEPAQAAEVSAAASGVLEAVLVERGARVQRGQVIAILQSQVEEAALQTARARAASQSEVAALAAARDLARTKLKRMHALAQLDRGGRLELETAAAEFEIADHRLQQAREALSVAQREEDMSRAQLDQRRIRSPIDGVVADRLLNPGERVDGRPIFRLLTLNRLRVEVVVPAKRFGEIKEGATATVTPEGVDAPEAEAKVVQVDRFVDPASGTFRARLSLPNPSGLVPPGARCRIAFAPAAEPAVPAVSAVTKEPANAAATEAPSKPTAPARPKPAVSSAAGAAISRGRVTTDPAVELALSPGVARVIEQSLGAPATPALTRVLDWTQSGSAAPTMRFVRAPLAQRVGPQLSVLGTAR